MLHAGIWCLIVLTLPLYVFPPGLPQPVHVLIAFAVLMGSASLLPSALSDRALIIPLWAFLGYAMLVNTIWFAANQDSLFLLSTLYLFFNALVFVYTLGVVQLLGWRLRALTAFALAIATATELLIVLSGLSQPHPADGAIGSFTNPNQLAYWAVLAAATILVIKKDRRLTLNDAAIIAGAAVLVILSLSRAGLISMVSLIALGSVALRKSAGLRTGMAIAVVSGIIAVFGFGEITLESMGLKAVEAELARETRWDSPTGRGYDRIWLFPQYLLLGAGEGGFERFAVPPLFFHNELHSSFGTIVFCYGIVGAALFCIFVLAVFRKLDVGTLMCLGPVFLFGLVHNSFRFSFFWMLLGLVYGMRDLQARGHAREQLAQRPDVRRRFPGERAESGGAFRPQLTSKQSRGRTAAGAGQKDPVRDYVRGRHQQFCGSATAQLTPPNLLRPGHDNV